MEGKEDHALTKYIVQGSYPDPATGELLRFDQTLFQDPLKHGGKLFLSLQDWNTTTQERKSGTSLKSPVTEEIIPAEKLTLI